uniref:Clusterin n=1 Tax=Leptobrachium leishanense TaxID=445787 RepID=A0A8C5MJ35_9ANUR
MRRTRAPAAGDCRSLRPTLPGLPDSSLLVTGAFCADESESCTQAGAGRLCLYITAASCVLCTVRTSPPAPPAARTEERDSMKKMSALPVLLLGLLLGLSEALLAPDQLQQMSVQGSKYITEQFENALNGVKNMKILMDNTGKEHQEILRTLEETKRNKEDALKQALESEQQLSEKQEVCNETVLALWEGCKPCLKQTCVRFYSKTCSSGSGLVGRQFEEFLNRSSPFSILVNGEKIDTLTKEDEQQHMTLEDLEDGYSVVEDSVDEIFRESMKAFGQMSQMFQGSFQGGFGGHNPFPFQGLGFPFRTSERRRERSPFFNPYFNGGFDSLFEAAQKMMERNHQLAHQGPLWIGREGNSTDNKVVCRELRRNSAGCLKMREKCEQCKEILAIDCSGKDPMQQHIKETFEDSVRLAEKFTKQYEEQLEKLREKMLNTTGLLERLNQQFGWVSRLANMTQHEKNGIFQISTVYSKTNSGDVPSDSTATVTLFDQEPFTFMVPGDITMEDPKFGELVAEEALKRYKTEVISEAA